MKCKRHPYELGVGVCASCLRERLLALIAAQQGRSPELRPNLDVPPPLPPPLGFPRSVSPYISHRRSVGSGPSPLLPQCRFFSTPQVGPTAKLDSSYSFFSYKEKKSKSKSKNKFSLFSALFGYSRSDDIKPSKSSNSWISSLIPHRRRNKSHSQSHSQFKSKSFHDRGMSPVRDDNEDSVCSSGYSTESSTGWRRPEPTPVRKFPSSSSTRHGRGVSGFAVCLSPLVRPSSKLAADLGISGDLLHQHRRHVSVGATSLVPSRSRKLVDHGGFR